MRLFVLAFIASALITSVASAQDSSTLVGGSAPMKTPGWARFEPTQAQIYIVSRARENQAHNDAIRRFYDYAGYDYAHPPVNPGMYTYASPLPRNRRYTAGSGFLFEYRGYGY